MVGSFEPSVWCFLFVTLFNLQGTRRSRRNIAIILNFISFVKHFFQSFLTPDPFSYQQQLFKFTTFAKLCQELFSEVFGFLPSHQTRQLFYVTTSRGRCQVLFSFPLCRSAHRGDSLVRIPCPPSFVNTFFPLFSLFSKKRRTTQLPASLLYIMYLDLLFHMALTSS